MPVSERMGRWFSGVAIPGWIVFWWTMMAHASTAAFINSVLGGISGFLDKHSWAGAIIAVGLLAVATYWPEIRVRLPKLPKTLHEQFRTFEKQIDKALDSQIRFNEGVGTTHNLLGERLTTLEEHRTSAIDKHSAVELRVRAVENKVEDALRRLEEHRPWISDLERRLSATTYTTNYVALEFTSVSLFIADATARISEADLLLYDLDQIQKRYPESDAARSPFGEAWWRPDVSPEPALVIDWALFVNQHLQRCQAFAAAFHIAESDVVDERLRMYASSWNNSAPSGDCMEALASHRAKLVAARQDYAASFSEKALRRITS